MRDFLTLKEKKYPEKVTSSTIQINIGLCMFLAQFLVKKKFLMCAKVLIFFAQKRSTSRSYGESRKSERFHVCFVNAHLLYSIIYFAKLHNVYIRPHLLISRSSSKRCRKFFTHQYSTR